MFDFSTNGKLASDSRRLILGIGKRGTLILLLWAFAASAARAEALFAFRTGKVLKVKKLSGASVLEEDHVEDYEVGDSICAYRTDRNFKIVTDKSKVLASYPADEVDSYQVGKNQVAFQRKNQFWIYDSSGRKFLVARDIDDFKVSQ